MWMCELGSVRKSAILAIAGFPGAGVATGGGRCGCQVAASLKISSFQACLGLSRCHVLCGATCINGIDIMPSRKVASKSDVSVPVTVAESHRDELDAVANRLESAGMSVAEKFRLGGVIAGEVARNKIGVIRKFEEVAAVEEEPVFKAGV
jgi:hypothetical protein